jgi:hypothetical protein
MIEKKPGVYDVDKLRTILLFHPEFNFGNKAIGRSMMGQAERLLLMPEAQYGSRHGKSASTQALNKVLLFELSRVQQIPMGYCSTDAKSCYDRIVHSFVALAMRRLGVPKEVTLTMFGVIKDMSHHVRTGYGESEGAYTSPPSEPFQGVGQGNGAGPAIWAAVSAPLLEFLHSRRRGVTFRSPITDEYTCVSAMVFVDDADIIGGLETEDSSLDDDLRRILQAQVSDWANALRVSGGAIVPEKSFYWSLNYTHGTLNVGEEGPQLTVNNGLGGTGLVSSVPVAESRRTLGIMINPRGTWKEERNKKRGQMEALAEACSVVNINRFDAMTELKERVLPKILYGLELTSFSRSDCRYIMAPALQTGLHLCGATRVLPREIVFGPESLLGLNIQDPYVAQGIQHLNVLSFYGPIDDSLTGRLIRCLMEEASITVGLGNNLLNKNFSEYGHLLKPGWVKTLWQFCYEHSILVEDWLPSIPLLREGDRYLIEVARGMFPIKDRSSIGSINRCRLFLGAISLADITQGNGKALLEESKQGSRPQWNFRSRVTFAASYPSSADWKVWRNWLSRLFPLVAPLGRWYPLSPRVCCLSASEDKLFLPVPLGWTQHELVTLSVRRKRYSLDGVFIEELPNDTLRTVVTSKEHGYISWGSATVVDDPSLPQDPNSSAVIYSNSFGRSPLDFQCSGAEITICSDGSYKDDRGTASWIAVHGEEETGADLIVPVGVHSAYRSELAGILGGLLFLDSISPSNLPSQARIVCDGLSALMTAFGVFPIQMSTSNYDILKDIRRCRASVLAKGVRLLPVHVNGHADDNREEAELSPDESLNVRMDSRAKAFWAAMHLLGWPSSRLSSSCTIRWQGKSTTGAELQAKLPEKALRNYWSYSKGFSNEHPDDWTSLSRATRSVRKGKGIFLTKFFSGFCGVNRWRKIWGLVPSNLCPRCHQDVETTAHLWLCEDPEACLLRGRLYDELIRWIVDKFGNLRFVQTIRLVLDALKRFVDVDPSSIPAEYWDAILIQSILGWENSIMGCWSVEWVQRLRDEFAAGASLRSPERVIAAIIARLWEISWDLWLGRNAAVYPDSEMEADGEMIQRTYAPTRLCRKERRRKKDGIGRSKAFMHNWLSRGSAEVSV